ncbi:MAG: hypothetical protein ACR2JN_00230, partial [Lapillicoccus sp.]
MSSWPTRCSGLSRARSWSAQVVAVVEVVVLGGGGVPGKTGGDTGAEVGAEVGATAGADVPGVPGEPGAPGVPGGPGGPG